jgi:hypothetical protein
MSGVKKDAVPDTDSPADGNGCRAVGRANLRVEVSSAVLQPVSDPARANGKAPAGKGLAAGATSIMADQLMFRASDHYLLSLSAATRRGAVSGGERLRPGSSGPPVDVAEAADLRPGVRCRGNDRARRAHRIVRVGRGGRGAGYSAAMIASNSARSRSSSSHSPRNTLGSAVSTLFMAPRPIHGRGVRRRRVAGPAAPAGRSRSCGAWPSPPLESSA